jgi:hypothetical protein
MGPNRPMRKKIIWRVVGRQKDLILAPLERCYPRYPLLCHVRS